MTTVVDDEMIDAFYAASVVRTRRLRYPTAQDFDDLVQEGVVWAWMIVRERDLNDPLVYGKVVAGRRVVEVASGRVPMLGGLGQKATYEPHRHAGACVTFDHDSVDALDPVESTADHTALAIDVSRAVAGLSPDDRSLVVLYAAGYSWREISQRLGKSERWAENRFYTKVRPRLRTAFTGVTR